MKHILTSHKTAHIAQPVFINVPDSSVIEARLYFRAGFSYFTKDNYQVPHILEHMLLANNKIHNSQSKLALAMQNLGADTNASTDQEHITVYLRAPAGSFLDAFQIILDGVMSPKITKTSLDRELEIIRREMYERFDGIAANAMAAVQAQLLPNEIPGTLDEHLASISAVKPLPIQLAHNQYISLANAKLIVAGKLPGTQQKAIIKLLSTYQAQPEYAIPPEPRNQIGDGGILPFQTHPDDSSSLILSYYVDRPAVYQPAARVARNMADALLFSAPAAEIPIKLRDAGLAYSITSDAMSLPNGTLAIINVLADRASLPQATAEIIAAINQYGRGQIKQSHIDSLKAFLTANLETSTETVSDLIEWYSRDILDDRPILSVTEELALVQNMTKADLAAGVRSMYVDTPVYGALIADDADAWHEPLYQLATSDRTASRRKLGEQLEVIDQSRAKAMLNIKQIWFMTAYYVLMTIAYYSALWVSQLPVKGQTGTTSIFDYAWDVNPVWGIAFWTPFIIAGLLTFVRKRDVSQWIVLANFVAAVVYAYGIFVLFGDVGVDEQPWYEDIISILQPLFFFVACPVAVYLWIKNVITSRPVQ